jgi:bacterioferritin-associated ferredoxin
MYICFCKAITDRQIRVAVIIAGATSLVERSRTPVLAFKS